MKSSVSKLRRAPPLLLARIGVGVVLTLPLLAVAFLWSRQRIRRWKNPRVVARFMDRHGAVFGAVDGMTLQVETISGGVSNCSFIWRCRKDTGEQAEYVAKLFLPLGSVWARLLPILGPFPRIQSVSARERLYADAWARMRLVDHRVPVVEPLVVDAADCLAVSEYLQGEPLTNLLGRAEQRDYLTQEDCYALWQCGELLARIHAAGCSVIDAQPANCLWARQEGQVYMLDFEYAVLQPDRQKWDVNLFSAFLSAQLSRPLEMKAQELFRQGYLDAGGDGMPAWTGRKQDLEAFLPIFQTILDLRSFSPEELVGLSQEDPARAG